MNREFTNRRILTLALEGLKSEREKIDGAILAIQERLDISPRGVRRAKTSGSRISAAGRESISEAMKKHWIERRRKMAKKQERERRK